jgi:hypothetical protein
VAQAAEFLLCSAKPQIQAPVPQKKKKKERKKERKHTVTIK